MTLRYMTVLPTNRVAKAFRLDYSRLSILRAVRVEQMR